MYASIDGIIIVPQEKEDAISSDEDMFSDERYSALNPKP